MDYLSSVSGGGYIATCYTWLRARGTRRSQVFRQRTRDADGSVLDWLRAHGKYLIAHKGFTGWTLGASILAAVLLNLVVMLPPLMLLLGVAAADLLPVSWPAWAQPSFMAPVSAHDGFVLMLWTGLGALSIYPLLVATFAVVVSWRAGPWRAAVLRLRRWMGVSLNAGVGLLLIGLVPLVANATSALALFLEHDGSEFLVKAGLVVAHLSTGTFLMHRAQKSGQKRTGSARNMAMAGLVLLLYGLLLGGYHVMVELTVIELPVLLAASALSVTLATVCDVNQISMHSYYRARLADAFLPALSERGAANQSAMDARLADVEPRSGAPFPIINTTLNVNSSPDPALRSRGAASFVLTPLFCGSMATGYRATASYGGGRMALSTAMTISGAAVDPNTSATRSRPVSFLMALLNFRLGYWTRNPRTSTRRVPMPWWYLFIGREMFGQGLGEHRADVHLTDGGHFENLGAYELLKRRCRRIVVCDAGADPDGSCADLGLAIQRARMDFGAQVDLDVDALTREARPGLSQTTHVLGAVRYADGSTGEVLYIKPRMCEGLTADIYAYWRAHPEFPNEPTADQFFDDVQFDAYRELGRQLLTRMMAGASSGSLSGWFASLRAEAAPLAPVADGGVDRDATTKVVSVRPSA